MQAEAFIGTGNMPRTDFTGRLDSKAAPKAVVSTAAQNAGSTYGASKRKTPSPGKAGGQAKMARPAAGEAVTAEAEASASYRDWPEPGSDRESVCKSDTFLLQLFSAKICQEVAIQSAQELEKQGVGIRAAVSEAKMAAMLVCLSESVLAIPYNA